MNIRTEDAERYLQECYPELTLGPMIGYGATASVFELPGLAPPQVIKMMDTAALTPVNATRKQCKRMYDYFQNEARSLERVSQCKRVMCLYDWEEYKSPEDRYQVPQYRSYKSVFLLRLERLQTLRECLRETGLTERELVQLGMDICEALQCCEDNKILHRDVKPDNIFVRPEGNEKRFVLGDFGICREFEEVDVRRLTLCGTQAFWAPELMLRTVKEGVYNSDIFSLGTTLFNLASGGQFPDYTDPQQYNNLSMLGCISKKFARVILQAVEREPDKRQQHAKDMYRQLEKLLPGASKQVVAGNHYMLTKQLMLNGKYEEAIAEAREGAREEEADCKRLLAYCLYNQGRLTLARETDPQKRAYTHAQMEKAEKLLDRMVYAGDVNAQYIRAQMALDRKDWEGFLEDICDAAEEGSILAAYRYGRVLYYGENGPRRPADGFELLRRAADAGYLEAVRIVARIAREDSAIAGAYANQYRDIWLDLTPRQKQEQLVKFL